MTSNIKLRAARRSDIPELARITNAANANSAIHKRVAPGQDQYPSHYYQWRLNIVRERFATPDLRTIVAEDSVSGEILGQASWAVEGSGTALYKEWVGESSWFGWLERNLIWAENTWFEWVRDKSVDRKFFNEFIAAFKGAARSPRPSCVHLHLIVVDPTIQSKGVGRVLMDWGKDLVTRYELPLFLESNIEAPGFYEKIGCSRMSKDVVVSPAGQKPIHIPVFVWEGEQRQGRWLERDTDYNGSDERWKWKAGALFK